MKLSSEEFVNLTQPYELSEREKEDGMGAYLMMFAAFAVGLPLPVVNLIAALIYYSINRKKGRFIHFHCLQSFLSQIPTTVLNWGLLYWVLQIYLFNNHVENNFFFAYIILVVIANLIYIVFSIVAAVKARKGKFYYFLFFGPYAYNRVYSKSNSLQYENEEIATKPSSINTPPY
jgi:uncharacterized membrane protein